MKLSVAAQKVIALSLKVREYYASELPKRHPNYPVIGLDEPETPSPPEENELREFLDSLDAETVYQLILIMYLGRGDFGSGSLADAYDSLKDTFDTPAFAIAQMMEKAPLADYLSDGLAILKKQKLKVDSLPLAPAKTSRPSKI